MRRRFHAVPEAVAQAVHAVDRAMRRAGLPDELMDRVTLAMGEAAGNAVEHGCAWNPECTFEVTWEESADGHWLRIQDGGAGIDPARLEAAALPDDPLSTSGRGLFLIRELADEVRLESGGRCLALRFVPGAG